MIPGDIDLTENLDFRNVRRRETPQLPAVWNGKKDVKLNEFEVNYATSFTSNTTSTTISGTSFNIISYNNIVPFELVDDVELWQSESQDTYSIRSATLFSNSNLNTWNVSIEYDANVDMNTNTANISTYSTTFNTISDTYYSLVFPQKKKKEYDVFGNIKKTDHIYIPRIPWEREKAHSSFSIPWDKEKREVIPDIPREWRDDIISNTSIFDKYEWLRMLDDKFGKVKKLISWLSDKSRSFIKSYLDSVDNDDNLSYLTNMNHIRVKDAIID